MLRPDIDMTSDMKTRFDIKNENEKSECYLVSTIIAFALITCNNSSFLTKSCGNVLLHVLSINFDNVKTYQKSLQQTEKTGHYQLFILYNFKHFYGITFAYLRAFLHANSVVIFYDCSNFNRK